MTYTIKSYINKLANWNGSNWAGVDIQRRDISSRVLELVIPPGASASQMEAIQKLQIWAEEIGVALKPVSLLP